MVVWDFGAIQYQLYRPLFDAQRHENWLFGTPRTITRAFLEKQVARAIVSSGAVTGGENARVGVAFCGNCPSVRLLCASAQPVRRWRSIAVTGASITSILLLQILLRWEGATPTLTYYHGVPPKGYDGVLVIGDAALQHMQTPSIDLCGWWYRYTGLPVCFAHYVTHAEDQFEQQLIDGYQIPSGSDAAIAYWSQAQLLLDASAHAGLIAFKRAQQWYHLQPPDLPSNRLHTGQAQRPTVVCQR